VSACVQGRNADDISTWPGGQSKCRWLEKHKCSGGQRTRLVAIDLGIVQRASQRCSLDASRGQAAAFVRLSSLVMQLHHWQPASAAAAAAANVTAVDALRQAPNEWLQQQQQQQPAAFKAVVKCTARHRDSVRCWSSLNLLSVWPVYVPQSRDVVARQTPVNVRCSAYVCVWHAEYPK